MAVPPTAMISRRVRVRRRRRSRAFAALRIASISLRLGGSAFECSCVSGGAAEPDAGAVDRPIRARR